jgi:predicted HicB family RNase H-like nuclease
MYPAAADLAEFEQTEEYKRIQAYQNQLLVNAKDRKPTETTRVITVRLPESVHAALKGESDLLKVSMNTLCIAKLLPFLEGELNAKDGQPKEKTERAAAKKAQHTHHLQHAEPETVEA